MFEVKVHGDDRCGYRMRADCLLPAVNCISCRPGADTELAPGLPGIRRRDQLVRPVTTHQAAGPGSGKLSFALLVWLNGLKRPWFWSME